MQHKRKSHLAIISITLIAVIAVSAVMLMTKDIKPTQQVVEKQLDASSFTASKQ